MFQICSFTFIHDFIFRIVPSTKWSMHWLIFFRLLVGLSNSTIFSYSCIHVHSRNYRILMYLLKNLTYGSHVCGKLKCDNLILYAFNFVA
jgi:hypothetical protein